MDERENYTSSNETIDLTLYEKAMSESFMDRVLSIARDYNRLFREANPTEEERAEIQQELDREWQRIMGHVVRFTGTVQTVTREGEYVTMFLNDVSVVTEGFVIEDSVAHIDSEVYPVARVAHFLKVQLGDLMDAPEFQMYEGSDLSTLFGVTADIEGSVVESFGASVERATAWLSLSCPELLAALDEAMLNSEDDETRALLNLKELDLRDYEDLSDEFTRMCIEIYINAMMQLDKEVPYIFSLYGIGTAVESDSADVEVQVAIDESRIMGFLPFVSLQEYEAADSTGDTAWLIGAHITLLAAERADSSFHMVMPISGINDMQSIRQLFAQG